jgi:dTDP-4-amino-4,6-dideoxygalactose transaminase
VDPIGGLAQERGILVLEDGAQAHGAEYRGRRVGSLADAAAFSFYFTKNLGGYGEGGAVTTDSDEIAQALVELRNHGETAKYVHSRMGYNNRCDEIQAAVLRIKLKHLDSYNDQRRAVAERYARALADTDLVRPTEAEWARHVYHLYVVRSRARDQLAAHLQQCEIGYSLHYKRPCHLQEAVRKLDIRVPTLPVAESAAEQVIGLPMYPQLSEDQQDYVIRCVRELKP